MIKSKKGCFITRNGLCVCGVGTQSEISKSLSVFLSKTKSSSQSDLICSITIMSSNTTRLHVFAFYEFVNPFILKVIDCIEQVQKMRRWKKNMVDYFKYLSIIYYLCYKGQLFKQMDAINFIPMSIFFKILNSLAIFICILCFWIYLVSKN